MKTRKIKILVPVIAIVFAMTTAFSSSVESKTNAPSTIDGYVDAPAPCMIKVDCSSVPGPICTNGLNGPQAFAKSSPQATTCSIIAYRPL